MPELSTIYDYMRANASLLGARILLEYPALHQFEDPVSPRIENLLRKPFPAQTIAIMGLAKRWHEARTGMVIAECGTGKTLISLGAIHVHSAGKPFTSLAMVPPYLVEKWAREAFLTLPGIRVFLIDDLRNGGDENKFHGVNEVRFRQGRIVREGFRTTLSELRLRKQSSSSRKRWWSLCGQPSLFIVGRERAKLGYFWRHAYGVPRSGPYLGCVVNSDTGKPVFVDDRRLTVAEFEKVKIAETIETREGKSCRPIHSPLWRADPDKIRRMAPIEFIGRYMPRWFDYAICDEIHQLAGDTAQGNALGTLAAIDRMQRSFEPMRKQVEAWQRSELTDVTAKVVIYEAFVEGELEAPKHLARTVHDLYFEPKYEEFRPRTIWSLSNAFTSAFKELDPIPQFRATAKLGEFLEGRFSQSF